jgi:hypothetical protein
MTETAAYDGHDDLATSLTVGQMASGSDDSSASRNLTEMIQSGLKTRRITIGDELTSLIAGERITEPGESP